MTAFELLWNTVVVFIIDILIPSKILLTDRPANIHNETSVTLTGYGYSHLPDTAGKFCRQWKYNCYKYCGSVLHTNISANMRNV